MRGREGIRGGLALGELLVLVAVVGGLVGLTRGTDRPSAEETCLANVKTICAAIRMYAGDYGDRLPPKETSVESGMIQKLSLIIIDMNCVPSASAMPSSSLSYMNIVA